jgi:hypothetical protein
MIDDPILSSVRAALTPIDSISALVLGGSRARGAAHPASDYDFGLYYDPSAPLDVAAISAALRPIVDDPPGCFLTKIGEWGPWIDGGGWLKIGGCKVDLLYRDLSRVRATIVDCHRGQVTMDYQPGHPHGFCSAILAGEVALCTKLLDRHGALEDLKERASPYPEALRRALIAKFHWEVAFAIANGELGAARGDRNHVAGCAYRALCCLAQVLFAINRRYLINEKGALSEACGFDVTIDNLAGRVASIWAAIGESALDSAISELSALTAGVDRHVANPPGLS